MKTIHINDRLRRKDYLIPRSSVFREHHEQPEKKKGFCCTVFGDSTFPDTAPSQDDVIAPSPSEKDSNNWIDKRKVVTSLYLHERLSTPTMIDECKDDMVVDDVDDNGEEYDEDERSSSVTPERASSTSQIRGKAMDKTLSTLEELARRSHLCATATHSFRGGQNELIRGNAGEMANNIHHLGDTKDPKRLAYILIRLRVFAMNSAEFRLEMAKLGGIPMIVQIMKEHKKDSLIQEHGCGILWNVSADDMINMQIVAWSGGIDAIIAAMLNHPRSFHVQWNGCGSLGQLAQANPIYQESIGSNRGIQPILNAMFRFQLDEDLQSLAFGALHHLAKTRENQALLASGHGLRIILNSMKKNGTNAAVQEDACATLLELATDEEIQICLALDGAIEAILSAMREHAFHARIQWYGSAVLLSLAKTPSIRKSIELAGGILSVLDAMRRNTSHIPILVFCCSILRELCVNNKENCNDVAAMNGIDIIIDALAEHSSDAVLQQNGFGALAVLAVCFENKKAVPVATNQNLIASRGGIVAILAGMRTHTLDPGVQEIGCMGLANLTFDNPENQRTIAAEGGMETIVDALRLHSLDSRVPHYGNLVLGELAFNNTRNQRKIAEVGGIEAVLEGMRHNSDSSSVQFRACRALKNLAADKRNKSRIRNRGGESLLETARRLHRSSSEVQKEADAALRMLD